MMGSDQKAYTEGASASQTFPPCLEVSFSSSPYFQANMYIYKTPAGQPVLLDEGPEVGKYNRANRSLTHFTEWAAAMCVAFLMVAYCFPVPAFVLTIVYALGRVLHQIGYAAKGYGGHAKGFMLNSIANSTMEGFLLLVALKGFDIM